MVAAVPDEFGAVADEELFKTVTPATALDLLKHRLEERQGPRLVRLRDVQARPDLLFVCRVPKEAKEQAHLIALAEREEKRKGAPPGGLILAAMHLARFCTRVTLDGQDLTPDNDPDASAFAYPPLLETLGADRAWQGVIALVDDDYAVVRLFDELMVQAGAKATVTVEDEELSDEDPTRDR